MNTLFAVVGVFMIAGASSDAGRTIGAVMAGAGLNDILREHKEGGS